MRKWIFSLLISVILAGCGTIPVSHETSSVNNHSPNSETENQGNAVEQLTVQRGQDVFTKEHPPLNMGIITSANELYTLAYRKSGEEIGIKTSQELGFPIESPKESGTVEKERTYIRLVKPPFLPDPGVNEFPRKDIILYVDPQSPDDAFVAIQNPEKLDEWRVLKVSGYGPWLKKEIDLYLSLNTGL